MNLVIATTNLHKLREYKAMLRHLSGVDIYSLRDFPEYTPPPEEGKTFEEIAQTKASHAAKALGKLVIADDSGLVIPALGGQPGIYSNRYAGEGASDKENRTKLIQALSSLPEEERVGHFVCVIAIASPEGVEKCVTASVEGHLIDKERGGQGFGYDPLFIKHEYSKTYAELDEETKNRISHRKKALDKILPTLETVLHSANHY